MAYNWSIARHRNGTLIYTLKCPLLRGEHRPEVFVSPDGEIFAKSIHGYSRQFRDVLEAQRFAGNVPLTVRGFVREGE